MTLEAEKQRWTGRLQRAEMDLADMLWKGEIQNEKHKSNNSMSSTIPTNFIPPKSSYGKKSKQQSEKEENTLSYYSLVDMDMLDLNELDSRKLSNRMTKSSSASRTGLPFISSLVTQYNQIESRAMTSPSSVRSSIYSSQTPKNQNNQNRRDISNKYNYNAEVNNNISYTNNNGSYNPNVNRPSPGSRHAYRHSSSNDSFTSLSTNKRDGSLLFQLNNPDGYKGYTPTGAHSRGRGGGMDDSSMSRVTVSSLGDEFSSGKL